MYYSTSVFQSPGLLSQLLKESQRESTQQRHSKTLRVDLVIFPASPSNHNPLNPFPSSPNPLLHLGLYCIYVV
ncbi:hypothetical protein ABKV19_024060 [Rosa sericea]